MSELKCQVIEDWKLLRDITLGQYFPTGSVLHKLDPRLKIFLVFAFIVAIFIAKSWIDYSILFAFMIAIMILSKISFYFYIKSLKPLVFLMIFTGILNLFVTPGTVIWSFWFLKATYEGARLAIYMLVRIVLLISASSVLTYTTSPIQLTNGLESLMRPLKYIKFPSHEVAMMMTIALRFIPTLLEETDKIMKAQQARGADFTSGGLIKRARALIPILIPLFISSFRRADELAVAMESRCYNGGEGRTSLNTLKFTYVDLWALLICAGVIASIFIVP